MVEQNYHNQEVKGKKILKPLKEKITNPIRPKTGVEPVGMILDKTEVRIGKGPLCYEHNLKSAFFHEDFVTHWKYNGNETINSDRNQMEE